MLPTTQDTDLAVGDEQAERDWLAEATVVMDEIERNGIEYVVSRFRIGQIIDQAPQRLVQTADGSTRHEGKVNAAMRLLNDEGYLYKSSWLYESWDLYREPRWRQDPGYFTRWMIEAKERGDRVSWTAVREIVRGTPEQPRLSPSRQSEGQGAESEVEAGLGLAEYHAARAEEELERARTIARNTGVGLEEVEGFDQALGALRHEVMRSAAQAEQGLKETTYYNEAVEAFIKSLPCYVTGGPAVLCHYGVAGKSLKTSSLMCVPLADHIHKFQHQYGYYAAEREFGFSYKDAVIDTMHRLFSGQAAPIPHLRS